jgi:hypothetical protein
MSILWLWKKMQSVCCRLAAVGKYALLSLSAYECRVDMYEPGMRSSKRCIWTQTCGLASVVHICPYPLHGRACSSRRVALSRRRGASIGSVASTTSGLLSTNEPMQLRCPCSRAEQAMASVEASREHQSPFATCEEEILALSLALSTGVVEDSTCRFLTYAHFSTHGYPQRRSPSLTRCISLFDIRSPCSLVVRAYKALTTIPDLVVDSLKWSSC